MHERAPGHSRFQYRLGELFWFMAGLMLAVSCMRYGWLHRTHEVGLSLGLVGLAVAGATVGAAIGRAFEDDRGGVTWLGAYLGTISAIGMLFLAPLLGVLLLAALRWLN